MGAGTTRVKLGSLYGVYDCCNVRTRVCVYVCVCGLAVCSEYVVHKCSVLHTTSSFATAQV